MHERIEDGFRFGCLRRITILFISSFPDLAPQIGAGQTQHQLLLRTYNSFNYVVEPVIPNLFRNLDKVRL